MAAGIASLLCLLVPSPLSVSELSLLLYAATRLKEPVLSKVACVEPVLPLHDDAFDLFSEESTVVLPILAPSVDPEITLRALLRLFLGLLWLLAPPSCLSLALCEEEVFAEPNISAP